MYDHHAREVQNSKKRGWTAIWAEMPDLRIDCTEEDAI